MSKVILKPNKKYTFSDYFKLKESTKEIIGEFGYNYYFAQLNLPSKKIENNHFDVLKTLFYNKLPHIALTSETARREFIISPLLLSLLDYVNLSIQVEYSININDKLKGTIDYLLQSSPHQQIIVIEAKHADLESGFTQLAIELIAMDYVLSNDIDTIYGVVTTGNIWQFGLLNRTEKKIIKDIDVYALPSQIEQLFYTFNGILTN